MLYEEVFRIPAFRDLVLKAKVKSYFAVRSFDPVHEKCDIFDGPVQLFGACHRQEIDGVVFIQELSAAGFFGRFYIIHAVIFGLKSIVDPVFITAEILNGAVGQLSYSPMPKAARFL